MTRALRPLNQADDVAVRVLPGGDQLAPTDILDLVLRFHASDMSALLAPLDPDVVVRADRAAVEMGASKRGSALVNGAVELVWALDSRPKVVFGFTITRGKIVAIDMLADPERLSQLDLTILDG